MQGRIKNMDIKQPALLKSHLSLPFARQATVAVRLRQSTYVGFCLHAPVHASDIPDTLASDKHQARAHAAVRFDVVSKLKLQLHQQLQHFITWNTFFVPTGYA